MIRLTAVIDEAQVPFEHLTRLAEKLSDWRQFWLEILLPTYLMTVQQNWDTAGSLVGGWGELSQDYERWKNAHYPGRQLMERTLRLRDAFRPGTISQDLELELLPTSLAIGTRIPYATYAHGRRPIIVPLNVDAYHPLVEAWAYRLAEESGLV